MSYSGDAIRAYELYTKLRNYFILRDEINKIKKIRSKRNSRSQCSSLFKWSGETPYQTCFESYSFIDFCDHCKRIHYINNAIKRRAFKARGILLHLRTYVGRNKHSKHYY